MHYLLFTVYLLVLIFIINKVRFVKNSGLNTITITSLFLIKVAAGLFIGWMSDRYYPQGNDYWNLNEYGWEEYQLMLNEPGRFVSELFTSHYGGYGGLFSSSDSYWNDLENNLIIKSIAIINIISRGDYYINSLFFSFASFFGHVALFRLFTGIFKNKKWPILIGSFLLPSTLYFASGIHKDSVIFTLLCIFCYVFYISIVSKRFTIKRTAVLLLSIFFIALIRNYVALALLPALFGWYLSHRYNNSFKPFIIIYSLALILFAGLSFSSHLNPLKIISNKQADFFDLPVAVTQLGTDTLHPTLKSLAINTPQATEHAFLRPYVWEFNNTFLPVLAIELLIYQILFIWMLFRNRYDSSAYKPAIWFSICFTVTVILFAGYIVPNAGSLVRYRSLYLPFLIIPILVNLSSRRQHINI